MGVSFQLLNHQLAIVFEQRHLLPVARMGGGQHAAAAVFNVFVVVDQRQWHVGQRG